MARKLQIYGTEEYIVKLTYEKSEDDRTEVEEEFHFDYYEEANEKFDELYNLWTQGKLGRNAHVEVVKVIVSNEVFNYF